jgi:Flp pilus assembly protein TadG
MNHLSGFSRSLRKLVKNDGGDMVLMHALSVVPMLLAVGASLDYSRYSAAQTHIQAAVDSAALSAAAMPPQTTDAARIAVAEASLENNLAHGSAAGLPLETSFTIVNKHFEMSASVEVPSSLMQLTGVSSLVAEGAAEANMAGSSKAEIAMVLDYSTSMNDTSGGSVKYVAMRKAASKLVNDLAASNPQGVKFGLVPFSHKVSTSLPGNFVMGGGSGTWTGCTGDRPYPANLTSATPTLNNNTKWNQSVPARSGFTCSGFSSRSLVVKPLTNNFTAVTSQLGVMQPYGYTHIALGAEFGYHLLTNNAPFTDAVPASDHATRKFMIVLTDGMQTEPGFGSGGTRSVAQGEQNLEDLCETVKADGITIITVAFDMNDTGTRQRLQACASGVGNFFIADDATDLSQAFETIKTAIATDIYLSK